MKKNDSFERFFERKNHFVIFVFASGNIDQNQYVDQVRILMDFIAPKISKEDIKTIWKLQHGRSSVAVDHLFTLIASAAAKFNLEQLNHLIEFISEVKRKTFLRFSFDLFDFFRF